MKTPPSSVVRNWVAAVGMMAAAYLIPLVLSPYLARTLMPDAFGALMLAYAIVNSVQIVVDWGFTLSAPARISSAPTDRIGTARAERILGAKLLLVLAMSAIGFAIVVAFGMSNSTLLKLIVISWVSAIGTAMTVAWFFQARHRAGSHAIRIVFARLLILPLTLLLVGAPADVLNAAAAHSVVAVTAGMLSVHYACAIGLSLKKGLSLARTFHELRIAGATFLTTAIVNWGPLSILLLLGVAGSPAQVAMYSVADRIRSLIQSFFGQLTLAFIPKVAHLASARSGGGDKLVLVNLLSGLAMACILLVPSFFFAESIVTILFGAAYAGAAEHLRVFVCSSALAMISQILSFQYLAPRGRSATRSLSVLLGWGCGLSSAVFIFHSQQISRLAYSVLIAEIVTLFLLVLASLNVAAAQSAAQRRAAL